MGNKRVVQVSFDVVDSDCDGTILAENIAEELDEMGYTIIGADFKEDVTEHYNID